MRPGSQGAEGRFEAAFAAHHRRVFAYARRRTTGDADAEDVVAETFAVAWRRIDHMPDADGALPWLLAVARRIAANQRRGSRRRVGLLARLKGQPVSVPGREPDTPALEALDRLRSDDQELLRLLAWDGLTQAEAGDVLGITANAVAIRLYRARKRFAAELAAVERDRVKGSDLHRTPPLVKGSVSRHQPGEREA